MASASSSFGLLQGYSSDSSVDRDPYPSWSDDPCGAAEHQVQEEEEKEEEQQRPSSDDPCSAAEQEQLPLQNPQPLLQGTPTKSKAYAAQLSKLPQDMRNFLAAVKTYFTQKVNLQRQKAALSQSTYDKTQERMLCKLSCYVFLFLLASPPLENMQILIFNFNFFLEGYLGYVRTVLDDRNFSPDCFLRIPLIEGYLEFLKVF